MSSPSETVHVQSACDLSVFAKEMTSTLSLAPKELSALGLASVLVVVRVSGERSRVTPGVDFGRQVERALSEGRAAIRRLGVAAKSVSRIVWYVRRDSVTEVQREMLAERALALGWQAEAEIHFVHTLSHPDSLFDLDLIAHVDLDDVKDRRPGAEISAPA